MRVNYIIDRLKLHGKIVNQIMQCQKLIGKPFEIRAFCHIQHIITWMAQPIEFILLEIIQLYFHSHCFFANTFIHSRRFLFHAVPQRVR